MLLLLTTASTGADAQTKWKYTYDATGNRVQRMVTSGSAARKKAVQQDKKLISDDGVTATMDIRGNMLKIETLGKFGTIATIYDLSGKKILSKRAEGDSMLTIDIHAIRHGVYILSIDMNGEEKSCKFYK